MYERVIYIPVAERGKALVAALCALWEESVRATHHFLNETDIEGLMPYVGQGLAGVSHLYVCGTYDSPTAFIGIEGEKIEMLFVSPRCFRMGLGRKLVDVAIRNHQAINVDVNEQNPGAIRFYERLGFRLVSRMDTDLQGNPFPILSMTQRGVVLQSDRLIVRPLCTGDVGALHAFMGRKEVMYAWEHGFTLSQVRRWIDRQIYRYYADGVGYWGVVLRADENVLIGQAGLLNTTINGRDVIELGYIFHDAYWHQGYAFEAARRCLEYAFVELHLEEVYCTVRPCNAPSVRLALRLGMAVCGEYTKRYGGKDMQHVIYRVKSDDFSL